MTRSFKTSFWWTPRKFYHTCIWSCSFRPTYQWGLLVSHWFWTGEDWSGFESGIFLWGIISITFTCTLVWWLISVEGGPLTTRRCITILDDGKIDVLHWSAACIDQVNNTPISVSFFSGLLCHVVTGVLRRCSHCTNWFIVQHRISHTDLL